MVEYLEKKHRTPNSEFGRPHRALPPLTNEPLLDAQIRTIVLRQRDAVS